MLHGLDLFATPFSLLMLVLQSLGMTPTQHTRAWPKLGRTVRQPLSNPSRDPLETMLGNGVMAPAHKFPVVRPEECRGRKEGR